LQLVRGTVKQILSADDNIDGIMADSDSSNAESDELDALRSASLISDDERFKSEEMIACSGCGRQNPPNRLACLYCGAELEGARTDVAKINFQQPESWEEGFSIVYAGKGSVDTAVAERAAEILPLEIEQLTRITSIGAPAPVAYLKSLREADILASRLADIDLAVAITGDDLLTPQVPPTRIRAIEFTEDAVAFEDFNTGNKNQILKDESLLLVTGSIFKTHSETEGKRSRRTTKGISRAEASFDEPVLDIYPASDVFGFRLRTSGFDFSCLGDRMQKLGADNLANLIDKLLDFFSSPKYVDQYQANHTLLDAVWPVELRNESSTVSRGTFGGSRIKRVTLSDNTAQFTRFSRLQRHFL
jgi:hypothetical protein